MTGVAIVRLNRSLSIRGCVLAIMATEAAWRILVADVIRVSFPLSVHLRKEIVGIYLLHRLDDGLDPRLIRIAVREQRGNAAQRLNIVAIRTGQSKNGVGFYPR